MPDGLTYIAPTALVETRPELHDLTTPRGRLLYLRDVVVPGIPLAELSMHNFDCGTFACLAGFAARDQLMKAGGLTRGNYWQFFGCNGKQGMHLFDANAYLDFEGPEHLVQPTHAELTAHINDVLEGRVK